MRLEEEELKLVRDQIDQLDYQLHDLFNQRAELALKVAQIKVRYHGNNVNFHRPEREKAIIENISAYNTGPLSNQAVINIFKILMSECLTLQQQCGVLK